MSGIGLGRSGLDRPHAGTPVNGSVYSRGPHNAGRPADAGRGDHYPLTAVCECGLVIECEHIEQPGWTHTGRRAGDSL